MGLQLGTAQFKNTWSAPLPPLPPPHTHTPLASYDPDVLTPPSSSPGASPLPPSSAGACSVAAAILGQLLVLDLLWCAQRPPRQAWRIWIARIARIWIARIWIARRNLLLGNRLRANERSWFALQITSTKMEGMQNAWRRA